MTKYAVECYCYSWFTLQFYNYVFSGVLVRLVVPHVKLASIIHYTVDFILFFSIGLHVGHRCQPNCGLWLNLFL